MKLKYFLDHPQIKRNKSVGNGNVPTARPQVSTPSTPASTKTPDAGVQAGKPSLAQQIGFGKK